MGRVGTGKSALLNGMINEMRQVRGSVTFGGSVGYGEHCRSTLKMQEPDLYLVPQQAWVQSGTIRNNIAFTFSENPEDVDLNRVNEVIDACGLRPDVDMWPDGDQ